VVEMWHPQWGSYTPGVPTTHAYHSKVINISLLSILPTKHPIINITISNTYFHFIQLENRMRTEREVKNKGEMMMMMMIIKAQKPLINSNSFLIHIHERNAASPD